MIYFIKKKTYGEIEEVRYIEKEENVNTIVIIFEIFRVRKNSLKNYLLIQRQTHLTREVAINAMKPTDAC